MVRGKELSIGKRVQIHLLIGEGLSQRQIATRLKVSCGAVRCVDRLGDGQTHYSDNPNYNSRKRSGRPTAISLRTLIIRWAKLSPRTSSARIQSMLNS